MTGQELQPASPLGDEKECFEGVFPFQLGGNFEASVQWTNFMEKKPNGFEVDKAYTFILMHLNQVFNATPFSLYYVFLCRIFLYNI